VTHSPDGAYVYEPIPLMAKDNQTTLFCVFNLFMINISFSLSGLFRFFSFDIYQKYLGDLQD
jgi:hypothetical protein